MCWGQRHLKSDFQLYGCDDIIVHDLFSAQPQNISREKQIGAKNRKYGIEMMKWSSVGVRTDERRMRHKEVSHEPNDKYSI